MTARIRVVLVLGILALTLLPFAASSSVRIGPATVAAADSTAGTSFSASTPSPTAQPSGLCFQPLPSGVLGPPAPTSCPTPQPSYCYQPLPSGVYGPPAPTACPNSGAADSYGCVSFGDVGNGTYTFDMTLHPGDRSCRPLRTFVGPNAGNLTVAVSFSYLGGGGSSYCTLQASSVQWLDTPVSATYPAGSFYSANIGGYTYTGGSAPSGSASLSFMSTGLTNGDTRSYYRDVEFREDGNCGWGRFYGTITVSGSSSASVQGTGVPASNLCSHGTQGYSALSGDKYEYFCDWYAGQASGTTGAMVDDWNGQIQGTGDMAVNAGLFGMFFSRRLGPFPSMTGAQAVWTFNQNSGGGSGKPISWQTAFGWYGSDGSYISTDWVGDGPSSQPQSVISGTPDTSHYTVPVPAPAGAALVRVYATCQGPGCGSGIGIPQVEVRAFVSASGSYVGGTQFSGSTAGGGSGYIGGPGGTNAAAEYAWDPNLQLPVCGPVSSWCGPHDVKPFLAYDVVPKCDPGGDVLDVAGWLKYVGCFLFRDLPPTIHNVVLTAVNAAVDLIFPATVGSKINAFLATIKTTQPWATAITFQSALSSAASGANPGTALPASLSVHLGGHVDAVPVGWMAIAGLFAPYRPLLVPFVYLAYLIFIWRVIQSLAAEETPRQLVFGLDDAP